MSGFLFNAYLVISLILLILMFWIGDEAFARPSVRYPHLQIPMVRFAVGALIVFGWPVLLISIVVDKVRQFLP